MGEREIMKQISMHAKLHKASVEITVIDELGVVHSLLWCFRNETETQSLEITNEEETEVSKVDETEVSEVSEDGE